MTVGRDPSELEVNQVEAGYDEIPEVPVRINGPVEARTVPAVAWTVTRFGCSDSAGPIKATSRNPYRRILRLSTAGTPNFLYGASNEQVRTRSTAGIGSATISPVELTHIEEVWINSAVAGETPEVTVVEEMWTN